MAAFKLIRYVRPPAGGMYVSEETQIVDAQHLERELSNLAAGSPTFVELIAPNGDLLNIGIGGSRGSVTFATQLMVEEGRTLDVVGTGEEDEDEYVYFDVGGTATPVAVGSLIDVSDVIQIAKHFLATGDIPRTYEWE